jgi:guanine deaminase
MTVAAATATTAFRGRVLQFVADPADAGERAHVFDEDGVLVVRDGRVVESGDWAALRKSLPQGTTIVDHSGKLILPGFIDTHIHYPQSDIIASYGEQLLEWLDRYTFPTERRFADRAHAREVASFFLDELLRNGTTPSSRKRERARCASPRARC